MNLKEFVKSKAFVLALFILLELAAYLYGLQFVERICERHLNGTCSSNDGGLFYLLLLAIPNAIIVLAVNFIAKKYYK